MSYVLAFLYLVTVGLIALTSLMLIIPPTPEKVMVLVLFAGLGVMIKTCSKS